MSERNLAFCGMRGYLIDCHRPDIEQVDFSGFSYETVVKQLQSMHIDHIMVYSKDHWGLAWYPTAIGTQHPSMKAIGLDYTAQMVKAAREAGIGVVVYYSVDTDDQVVREHPEWAVLDQFGNEVLVGEPGCRWHRADVMSDYGDYAIGMIEEVLKRYQPDGLFLDAFPPVLSFGEVSQQAYKRITGEEMPLGDEANRAWRKLQAYEENHVWLPFTKRVRHAIDTYSPNTLLTTNGCNAGMPKCLLDLMDYQFAEPWAGNHLSGAFVSQLMTSPQIGPGDLGLVYDRMPSSAIAGELISIGMNGARPFLYSESMDKDGSLIAHDVKRISEAFAEVERVQPLWDGKPLSQVTLLFSGLSHQVAPDRTEFTYKFFRESTHQRSLQAATAMCAALHLPYRCLDGDTPAGWDLTAEDLVVIPCAEVLPHEAYEALLAFAEKGGRVLAVLSRMPVDRDGNEQRDPAFEKLFGVTLDGTDRSFGANVYPAYADFTNTDAVTESLRHQLLGVSGTRLQVICTDGKAIGRYRKPITEDDFEGRVFWGWRPPVPSDENAPSVPAVINTVGRGSAMLITFDIFSMSGTENHAYWAAEWLGELLPSLCSRRIALEGLPPYMVVSQLKTADSVSVHVFNPQAFEGTTSRFTLRAEGCTALSQVYPCKQDYPCTVKDGVLSAALTLDGVPYTVFRLDHEWED